jgi:RNA polymerase sigma-70 factor (ECF subfamily)
LSRNEASSPGDLGEILYSKIGFLYRVCLKILLDRDEAEDAVSETLFRAFKKISTFKGESQLETWLYRIATNVCLDFLRRRKASVPLPEESNPLAIRDSQNAEELALSHILEEEKKKALESLMKRLKPRSRIILTMREVEGLSYEEIASRLNCPLGTVKSMINRAKRDALKIIEEDKELRDLLLRQKG